MNRDRAVAIVASTGMILTWLANAASPRPEPAVQPVAASAARHAQAKPDPSDALSFDVGRETARLRFRMSEAPAPNRHGRNPFSFAERRSTELLRPKPARRVQTPAADDVAVTPAVPPPPALKLIGVAERTTADGTIRSAVLSGATEVFIVGVSDQVLGRYTVVGIGADAIEVLDTVTGQPVRFALR